MFNRVKKPEIIFLYFLLFFTKSAIASTTIPFLAYGNLYLQIEPCGCDPSTDFGGIRRLSTLLSQVRRENPKILNFDLGNNFKEKLITHSDTFYLKKALDLMTPDVSLVNSVELKHLSKTLGKRKYVLSNAKNSLFKKTKNVFPFVKTKETLVFGFLEDKSNMVETNIDKLKKIWGKTIASSKVKQSILLFSGSDKALKQLNSLGLFDLIISSNTKEQEDKRIYDEQKKDHLLLRQFDRFHVKMIPMLGRGVLTHQVKVSKKSLFNSQNFAPDKSFTSSFSQKPKLNFIPKVSVYWLSKKYDLGSPLADFLKKYQSYKKDIYHQLAAARKKDLEKSPFAGAEACKTCHQKAYKIWKDSRHATAMNTLRKKEKNQDTSCIECHVLGWHEKGGFASEKDSPHFENVQCENCHGPAKSHTKDPRVKPKKLAFNSCTTCHNVTHSPNFEQGKYWKKIAH